ncbi:hypothetical protein Tco_0645019 [Tanacetum coccineum]
MHNDIMAAGSKDRPPMLVMGRYAQWQSRFMRYVDTKPNMKEMKKSIFNGPYVMTRVLVPAKPATKTYPLVPEHTVQETYENTLLENCAYIDAEADAIHMILSGIGDEIYSTVDACKTAQEIWATIKRLHQGDSLNNAPHQVASKSDGNRRIQRLINITSRLTLPEIHSAATQFWGCYNNEEYAMAVRDFKKFFRRRGKFVRQPHDDKKNFRKIKEDKKEKEDHSEEDSKKEEICLMALDNNEVRLKVKLEPDE